MDSSKYPEDDDFDNMAGSEQSIPEEGYNSEPETNTTNQNKRKKSPAGGEGESKRKKQVTERSDVWKHFTRLEDNPNKCKCHFCGKVMSCRTTSGTSSLKHHLTICKMHQAYKSRGGNQLNRERDGGVKYGRVSEVLFREASNELLVLGELPLSFIESLAWRNFCSKVKLYRPQCRKTTTKDIVQMYVQKKKDMRNLIGKQRVSLTTDIWTAPPTGASYMVITAHWIDASKSVNSYNCYGEIVTIERNLIALSQDPDKAMQDKALAMREKFDKYWAGLKEINKLLIVASVLNPTNKMCFATLCFEDLYGKGSRECNELDHSVNQVMNRLFTEYSSVFSKSRSSGLSQSQTTGTSYRSGGEAHVGVDSVDLDADNIGGYERIQFVYKKLVKEKGLPESSNELELYLKESVENPNEIFRTSYDVLSWWRLNAPKYPILSEIAKDVFAMQVSSVASESAFSTSDRVLDPSRNYLTHYTLEVLMCTQQWIKSSIHLKEKGAETTTQEILSQIVLQDQLEKEFNSTFQNN